MTRQTSLILVVKALADLEGLVSVRQISMVLEINQISLAKATLTMYFEILKTFLGWEAWVRSKEGLHEERTSC